jgi:hypothetical protein
LQNIEIDQAINNCLKNSNHGSNLLSRIDSGIFDFAIPWSSLEIVFTGIVSAIATLDSVTGAVVAVEKSFPASRDLTGRHLEGMSLFTKQTEVGNMISQIRAKQMGIQNIPSDV